MIIKETLEMEAFYQEDEKKKINVVSCPKSKINDGLQTK